jgi:hypothetical protein
MKYCKKCEKEYPENKTFCSDCGNKLVKLVEEKRKEGQKEYKISKQMSSKKLLLIIGAIVVIFAILIVELRKETGNLNVVNDYNNNLDLYYSDDVKMVDLYNTWINAYNNAIKDNQITASEVNQMKTAIENYAYEYNIVKQHLSNFREFIVSNENDLKNLNIDTFQMKNTLDDYKARLENGVNFMTTKTQDLMNTQQAQQQALSSILKILIGLA